MSLYYSLYYSLGKIIAKYIGTTKYYNIPAIALKKLNTAKILFKNIANIIDMTIYAKLKPIFAIVYTFLDFSLAFVNFNNDYTNGYKIIINTNIHTIPYNNDNTYKYTLFNTLKSENILSDTLSPNIEDINKPTKK